MYSEKQQSIFKGVLDLAARGENLYTVKVQDIATAAGVGKGTLYEYFPSKEDILANTLLWCLESELEKLEAALLPTAGFEQSLAVLQDTLLDAVRERGNIYHMVLNGVSQAAYSTLEAAYRTHVEQQRQRGLALEQMLIAKGRAEGKIGAQCTDEYCHYVIEAALVSMVMPLGQCQCCQKGPWSHYSMEMVRKALA